MGVAAVRADRARTAASTAAAPPTTRPASWRTSRRCARSPRRSGDDFDLGVVLFFEGEEEAGSRSFAQFLSDNADALRADVIVVADSGNWDARTPALTVSLRGNTRFTLRVRTLEHASHSGMFGGAVPDAMMATVKLLATLWDEDGAVDPPCARCSSRPGRCGSLLIAFEELKRRAFDGNFGELPDVVARAGAGPPSRAMTRIDFARPVYRGILKAPGPRRRCSRPSARCSR